jgi:hypothetical protein
MCIAGIRRRMNDMKKKLYLISAVLWYLGAICFSIAAGIGENLTYVALGVLYICIGSSFLALYILLN